jgi:uncharacterized phage infection (PIP) family protein YhgE
MATLVETNAQLQRASQASSAQHLQRVDAALCSVDQRVDSVTAEMKQLRKRMREVSAGASEGKDGVVENWLAQLSRVSSDREEVIRQLQQAQAATESHVSAKVGAVVGGLRDLETDVFARMQQRLDALGIALKNDERGKRYARRVCERGRERRMARR